MSVSCVSAVSGIYKERFYRQSSTFPSQLCAASRFLHTQPVQPVVVGRCGLCQPVHVLCSVSHLGKGHSGPACCFLLPVSWVI